MLRPPSRDYRDFVGAARSEENGPPSWRSRPSAPGPLLPCLLALGAMVAVGVLCAALSWSLWAGLGLLPEVVVLLWMDRLGARRRGMRSSAEAPRGLNLVLSLMGIPLVALGAATPPDRYVPLALAGFYVTIEVMSRAWWRVHDRRRRRARGPQGIEAKAG